MSTYINSALLIAAGQTYLHQEMNEYVIVTKVTRGHVTYEGIGFRGMMDPYDFIEQFPPVDPTDIDFDEVQALLQLCPESVEEATVGFICENVDFDEEEFAQP